jgi:hypothetical protein
LISVVKNLIDHKAAAEPPAVDGGVMASHERYRNNYNTAELNTRRGKIEDLIKLSAQPASENGLENGTMLKINTPYGNGRHMDSPSIANAPREVEIMEDVDMDNILELDDVLPDLTPVTMGPMRHDTPATAVPQETPVGMVIPQSVIDEIVNRVAGQLCERLSGEIARRIAPEVTELVRRRILAGPALSRDSENLLDID